MEEILKIILEYASIWGPSIVAIFSIVATIIGAYARVRKAIAETRLATEELKSNKTIIEMNNRFNIMAKQNEELVRTNKLLLEKITKIKEYADLIKGD